jgi:hypothetical protein
VGTGLALAGLLLAASAARPAPVPAASSEKTGLAEVPAGAPLVFYVRGVEGTKDRLVALLQKALPDLAPLVKAGADNALEQGIDGRKLRGVPKDGPIFVAFTEMPRGDEDRKVAVIVAVTRYADFRDNILKEEERKSLKRDEAGVEKVTLESGQPAYFFEKKGYAVVCSTEDVAKSFTRNQPGLDGKMSRELAAKFLRGGLGLYLSMDAFNKEYAEQIKKAREGVEQALEKGLEQAGPQKNMVDLVRKMVGPAFRAVEDSRGLLVTFEFRPGGLAFHAQSEFRPGSATARALTGIRMAGFKGLARMPAGQTYYSGVQTGPNLYEFVGSLMFGVMPDKESAEARAMRSALDQLMKAGPGSRLDAFNLPPAGLQVYHYQDPARAAEAQLKLVRAMRAGVTFQSAVLKDKPEVKARAQKYGAFELHRVHLVWDVEKMAEQGGGGRALPEKARKQLAEGMKRLLGSEVTTWFGTDGKVFVQVTARDWKAAERLLDDYVKGTKNVGGVAHFREVRRELPAEATFLTVVDVVKYAGAIVDLMKPLLGGVGKMPANFPGPGTGQPGYAGAAVTLRPDRAAFDFFLSAAATNEFYQAYIKPLRKGP